MDYRLLDGKTKTKKTGQHMFITRAFIILFGSDSNYIRVNFPKKLNEFFQRLVLIYPDTYILTHIR